jgi:ribosomal protein S18 acetylase RimI-like enzyme
MQNADIGRIGEIDRTEHVTEAYVIKNGVLTLEEVDWDIPPWSTDGRPEYSVQAKIEDWQSILDGGGVMFGALDGGRLVGFAIYRPHLTEDTAVLAVLHVSNGYRGRGIGTALAGEIVRLARADGARWLYVSSAPTKSTVDFYRGLGFHPTSEPHREMYEREPEDIHMIMDLREESSPPEDTK